jgi:excisionase family DNA binding protein
LTAPTASVRTSSRGTIPRVEEDTYTTGQAAKILKVSDSYLRRLVRSGEVEAVQDDNGRYLIPQRVIHAMLEGRRADALDLSESSTEASELRRRLEDLQRELGRLEGRLELTEKAESTMQQERERLIAQLEEERTERRRLQERVEELSLPWYRRWFR